MRFICLIKKLNWLLKKPLKQILTRKVSLYAFLKKIREKKHAEDTIHVNKHKCKNKIG